MIVMLFQRLIYFYCVCAIVSSLDKTPMRIVISLTTSPKRLTSLNDTLHSLLSQYRIPDQIYLNIPHIFKRTGEAYDNINKLTFLNNKIIRINRCDDSGPLTKLLPTVSSEDNATTMIIIVDDDTVYSPEMVSTFAQYGEVHPKKVLAASCGDRSYLLNWNKSNTDKCVMVEAFAGVAFRRSFFGSDFLAYSTLALTDNKCFRGDDFVVSNYLAMHGIDGLNLEGKIPRIKALDIGKKADALHQLELGSSHCHNSVYMKCSHFLRSHNFSTLHIVPPTHISLNDILEEKSIKKAAEKTFTWLHDKVSPFHL